MKKLLLLLICFTFLLGSSRHSHKKKKRVFFGEVTANKLNLRAGPGTKYKKIGAVTQGEKLRLISQKNGWIRVIWKKKSCWVSKKYIRRVREGGKQIPLGKKHVGVDLGLFKVTYYWIISEKDFTGPRVRSIYDKRGRLIGTFSHKFVKRLILEGTAKLKDGRIVNVAGRGRFMVVKAPYGLGAKNIPLQPFRSIAVDRKKIPIGTKIYIPQARGIKLPNGKIHDGIFYAHDVGGGIKGARIDIFTGIGDQRRVFTKRGIKNKKFLRLYKVVKKK